MILQGKKMRDRYEQVEMYSTEEYRRRATVVREEMKKKGVDVLVILDCTKESHDHWLTGKEFLNCVIVPSEGDIVGVLLDEIDESGFTDDGKDVDFERYVHQRYFVTNAEGVRFINRISEAGLAALIKEMTADQKVGIINKPYLTCALDSALRKVMPDLEYVELTREVDTRKTIKSQEELDCIRMSAVAQGQMMESLKHLLRPGRRFQEVRAEIRDQLVSMGGGGVLLCLLKYLGNQNEKMPNFNHYKDDVIIKEGDRFFTLYESNSYGGHCIAMGRVFIIGKATEEYKQSVAFAEELNLYAAARMKPGATLREIVSETKSYAALKGHTIKRMCWMHGLSTATYGEQYGVYDISYDWPLEEGMMLHCHPFTNRFMPWLGGSTCEDSWILNTYMVTAEGGRNLVKYPFGITEIELD